MAVAPLQSQLELELAHWDAMRADLRVLRLEVPAGIVDCSRSHGHQPKAAPLVEANGVEVVVRGRQPDAAAAGAAASATTRSISREPMPLRGGSAAIDMTSQASSTIRYET